jgi:hypothetical protein
MEITTIVCSVHHSEDMIPTEFKNIFVFNDRNTRLGYSCMIPTCNVCFSQDLGYFRLHKSNGKVELDPNLFCRRCAKADHDSKWLVLTRIDGTLKWACPDPRCNFSLLTE